MKRGILFAVTLALCCLSLEAKVRFQSIDFKGENVIVTLADDRAGDSVRLTEAVFHNDGREYESRSMNCDLNNGIAVYKLSFPQCEVYRKCSVTLTINGKQVSVPVKESAIVSGAIRR